MKFLKNLTKNENKMQRLIGLNYKQLYLLVRALKPLWEEAENKRLDRKNRKRAVGGGHPYKLQTIKYKIIAVLLYYKQYPTQEFLGIMLGLDQSSVSRLIQKILPLIEQAADPELQTYLVQAKENYSVKRIGNWIEFLAKYPDLKDVATDATEQQCYRAKNYEQQKKYYSGKSKQHTIKTQVSVSSTGRILDVSLSYPGSVHDKTIADTEKIIEKFHKNIPQRFDSGYQGIKNDYPHHYILLPIKKPKGRELTALEKEYNKTHSKRRVKAEHGISMVKKFKILGGIFRQPVQQHNQLFRNVAAIVNFKRIHPSYRYHILKVHS